MPVKATGGRPKSAQGHREDAILFLLDARGEFAELIRMLQAHYREERDLITRIDAHLRDSTLSTRYSELVEDMTGAAA